MPKVNFYLKKKEPETGRSLIYIQFHYDGQKLTYTFNETVSPADWLPKKQRLRENRITEKNGDVSVNTLLDNIENELQAAYKAERVTGIPGKETLKKKLDAWRNQKLGAGTPVRKGNTLFTLIDKFIAGTVGEKKTPATITTYKTAKKHLEDFQSTYNRKIDFNTIDLEFKYSYVKYLEKDKKIKIGKKKRTIPGLKQNSVYKEIKNIKTFMNMAVELGFTNNLAYKSKKFGVKETDTDAVYLNEKEIVNLYKHDFSSDKRLEAVRDLFVFSSFVGLRYSDAIRIKPENIVKIDGEDYIKITSQKTKTPVTIPCNDIVMKIIKKYNPIPDPISNQKFNMYIKEACELAGFTETGRLGSNLTLPLYKAITAHTARRNFATNCYLAGMDKRMIMLVTGHTTEKSFDEYIKVTRDESAKLMKAHMQRRVLKAV